MTPTPPERNCPTCGSPSFSAPTDCPNHWHVYPKLRNNPGYTPEYKELEEAREVANRYATLREVPGRVSESPSYVTLQAIRWLAAEVRVMRLERALEQ